MFCSVATAGTFVGLAGFLGAVNANFTVFILKRRTDFVGGHFCMMLSLFLAALFIRLKNGNLCLFTICAHIISFQSSNGAAFWVYANEIGQDAAMGLCIFILFGILFVQSFIAEAFIAWISIEGFFYFFGGF